MDTNNYTLLHNSAQFFELGQINSIERLSGGHANDNHLVSTEQGEFVLKEMLEHTLDETKLELLYVGRVLAHGIPAPPYLRGSDGTMIYREDERHVLAYKKVDGEPPLITEEVCLLIGQQVGKLHQIPCTDLPPKSHWMTSDYLPKTLEALKGHSLKYADQALATYEKLRHFDMETLPQVILHSDIHSGNLLFKDGVLQAILDWEEVGRGAAIKDIAGAILNPCLVDDRINAMYYRAFMKGYTQERALAPEESANLRLAVQLTGLTYSVWMLYKFGVQTPDAKKLEWGNFYWRLNLDTFELPAE